MSGPKPRPNELKLLHGEHPCRRNEDAPKPAHTRPECPSYVVDDEEALAEWERIVPRLERMRVLTEADGVAIGVYCRIHSRYVRALEACKDDLTISTGTGSSKPHPALTIAERCEVALYRALAEFGLTPSSRTRIKVGAQQQSNLEAFVSRRPKRSG